MLVSELMLQQTQVSRVIPRYEAWLERWPTAAALAGAAREDVLAAWVGLGYNRRALALWEAARIVARDGWPDDLRDAARASGPYTAAAVGSFAFGRQEVAVDVERRAGAGAAGRRADAAAGPGGRLQPGDDGARRDRLHGARGALRGVPAGGRLRVGGSAGGAAGARRPRGRASRTPTAGSAAASSPRWRRGRGCPRGSRRERLEPALEGLVRDGLVRRSGGTYALG